STTAQLEPITLSLHDALPILEGNQLILSTFDGNHAYLFKATKTSDSTLTGDFWSGKTLHRQWTATLDPEATLPDPEGLTVMREGDRKSTRLNSSHVKISYAVF